MMNPRVALKDFRITDIELRWVHAGKETGQSAPVATISQGPPPADGRQWFTQLGVQLDPSEGKSGYHLRISVAAVLEIDSGNEEPSPDKLAYLAALNGATIMYGIVRAEVASLTSNFPGGRHVLQTIYMDEVIRDQSTGDPEKPSPPNQ
ncbi:MAG: hypothetical protein JJU11_02815 [Candidatus Sumerlaeia bacterium]|nr:hypothetical protein [Candidatus Sumerlaeia bacterium]